MGISSKTETVAGTVLANNSGAGKRYALRKIMNARAK